MSGNDRLTRKTQFIKSSEVIEKRVNSDMTRARSSEKKSNGLGEADEMNQEVSLSSQNKSQGFPVRDVVNSLTTSTRNFLVDQSCTDVAVILSPTCL